MKRQDTRLESEGAEFLVLGNLLIEGIPAYKTYTNMAGYDLVATNPERRTIARIQVKSRWATRAAGFLIKNIDCDFVVIAKLNRGSKDGKAAVLPPQYYILPVDVIRDVPRTKGWGKILFRDIKNLEFYLNKWSLIRVFLERKRTVKKMPRP
jgi:hypothetical protein